MSRRYGQQSDNRPRSRLRRAEAQVGTARIELIRDRKSPVGGLRQRVVNRSSGGAISVARSRTSGLFVRGSRRISRGSNRAVQAYSTFPSTRIMHSLQAFALMQE